MNLKGRKDYIEPDYVNGVKNSKGETVIRALNEEEKDWLNQYYRETVVASLPSNISIKQVLKEIKKIKKDLNAVIKEYGESSIEYDEFVEESEPMYLGLVDRYEELQIKEDCMHPKYTQRLEIFNDNNRRNRCLYNKAKKLRVLKTLDIDEFDKFISNALENSGMDTEHIMLDEVLRRDEEENGDN